MYTVYASGGSRSVSTFVFAFALWLVLVVLTTESGRPAGVAPGVARRGELRTYDT